MRKQIEEADRLMREIGFTSKVFSPHSIVGQLSGGERQGVAIARAIYNNADLIILDEPTTALSLTETEKVFRFVRTVRESGRSILFIGHNIHHVYDIADRFVVLDRGRVVLTEDEELDRLGRGADLVHGRRRAPKPGVVHPLAQPRGHRMSDVALRHPRHSGLRGFVFAHRAAFGTLAVFVRDDAGVPRRQRHGVHALADLQQRPVTLPVAIFLVVPLVFIVTVGEIDLSFPATFGVAAWVFALVAQAGFPTVVAVLAAIATGGCSACSSAASSSTAIFRRWSPRSA